MTGNTPSGDQFGDTETVALQNPLVKECTVATGKRMHLFAVATVAIFSQQYMYTVQYNGQYYTFKKIFELHDLLLRRQCHEIYYHKI